MQTILRRRKQLATFLLLIFVTGTFFPPTLSTAQALFTRPGAGVSRLPLNVFAFDAPEFGMVSDAINLANGNVFLSMNDLARNNVVTAGQDETANSIGGSGSLWQLSSRLRLEGFRRDMTVAQIPATFFLGNGDGSGSYFKRVEKNTLNFTGLPTWIARYETTSNAYLYRLEPQNSLQYSQEWLVLLPAATTAANNAVAHYYPADGTRNTFYSDGEYLDYIQDIYQQYRSASAFDSEGISSSAKTQITYTAVNSGRISKIQDEYGRVTNYSWTLATTSGGDGDDTTLDRIVYLVVAPVAGVTSSTYARLTDFKYETTTINAVPIQRLKSVIFSAPDGLVGPTLVRSYDFTYTANNFIESITRKGNDPAKIPNLKTTYKYDPNLPNRIQTVERDDGTPPTTYIYSETLKPNTTTMQNFTITVAQDTDGNPATKNKETLYLYNSFSQLVRKGVYDSQLGSTGTYLYTYYYYYPTGSTKSIVYPSGMTEIYSYDEKGNVTEIRTLSTNPYSSTATTPAIAVTLTNPANGSVVQSSLPIQITALVTNDRQGSGVYWQALKPKVKSTDPDEPLGYITQKGVFFPPDQNTTVDIKATSIADPSKSAKITLTVKSLTLAVTAPKTALAVNDKLQLSATLTNDLTYTTPESFNTGVNWSTTAGTIDASGLFTAPPDVTAAVITATSKSDPKKSQSVKVTTYPPRIAEAPTIFDAGQSHSFKVEGVAQGVIWSTSMGTIDPNGNFIATVNSDDIGGRIQARYMTAGTYKYLYHDITVRSNAVRITNLPAASLSSGSTHQFSAEVKDPQGITWQVSAGTIDQNGYYTAPIVADETGVYITAKAKSNPTYVRDRIYFTIRADAVKITNAPSAALSSAATFDFDVEVKDPQGITWQASAGTINQDGLFTAPVASNDTQVSVTAKANSNPTYVTDRLYFTVKADAVKITATPPAALSSGATYQFGAEVKDPQGITWQASQGTISEAGLYTAPIVGDDTNVWVIAKSVSNPTYVNDRIYFTIKPDAVKISNAPSAALSSGATFDFDALVKDPLGITWEASQGTIDQNGVYTAPIVGSNTNVYVRVKAKSNPSYVSDYIYFTIKPDAVKITNGPAKALNGGETFQFQATVKDPLGITWEASQGTIDQNGVYTAPVSPVSDTQVYVRIKAKSNPNYVSDYVYFTIKGSSATLQITSATPDFMSQISSAGTRQFSANEPVVWSTGNGTISSDGSYTAPIVSGVGVDYITATSISTPSKIVRLYFTILPNLVAITNAPSAALSSNATFDFDAIVNDPQGIIWRVPTHTDPTFYGTIDQNGLYTAPIVHTFRTIYLDAVSKSNPAVYDRIWFTVIADAVEITNAPTAALGSAATFDFNAMVKDSLGVTWRLPSSSNPAYYGTIDETGVYTAPIAESDRNVWVDAVSKTNLSAYDRIWFTVRADAVEINNAPSAILSSNATFDFNATVKDPLGVTWRLASATPANYYGTINDQGVYTAPIAESSRHVPVIASSKTNPSVSKTIWFTVRADAVAISNAPITGLKTKETFDFNAEVKDPQGITWSLPTSSVADYYGTVSQDGIYTAPVGDSDRTIYLTATTRTNPSATDQITFTTRAIKTRIAQGPTVLDAGAQLQLQAEVIDDALNQGVTWTLAPVAPSTSTNLGTINAAGLYTAPIVDTDTQVTLTATSKTNPTKTSSLKFTVRAIKVVLQKIPSNTLTSGQSYKLNATAIFDAQNKGFTYSSSLGANTISADDTFAAPHVTSDTPVTLTATSKANPSKSDTITVTIKPPAADLVVPIDQGDPGAFAEAMTDPSTTTGEYVRKQNFVYDRDNRMILETTVGADGPDYTYQSVSQQHEIELHGAVTVNGQLFSVPRKVTHKTVLGGQLTALGLSGGQALADTYTFEKYDTRGLLVESVRRSKSQVQTTLYSYYADNTTISVPRANKGTGAPSTTRPVKQYADLVQTVTVVDLGSTTYTYDELGNVVREEQPNAFVRSWSTSGTGALADDKYKRIILRSFNGYGQQAWERVEEEAPNGTAVPVSVKVWEYYATGEPLQSWEGTSTNKTSYSYYTTLDNPTSPTQGRLGRVAAITKLHEKQAFVYDRVGRVDSLTQDDIYVTNYYYDSLDRVTREVMPNQGTDAAPVRGEVLTTYDKTGVVKTTTVIDPLAAPGTPAMTTTNTTIDSLGRVTTVTYPGVKIGTTTVLPKVVTVYDAFDRPVKVTDDRLTMNASGDDRASYFVYDSLGRLIKEVGSKPSTVAGQYQDARRPYTEYEYDLLGRQIKVHRLLQSETLVDPAQPAMPANKVVATTETIYDAYDRVLTVIDPELYRRAMSYDASGNVVQIQAQRTLGGTDNVTTHLAYDAAGRAVQTIDGEGGSVRQIYNTLGLVTDVIDQCNITTFKNTYTAGGLLLSVSEPAIDNTNINTSALCPPAPASYVTTKKYTYVGTYKYPQSIATANMNVTAPQTGAATTTYTYDYAGRTLTTNLPGGGSVTQSYDARGNLLNLTDADGFVTTYTYDAYNRVTSEAKPKRVGNTGDAAAFPSTTFDGLKTTYTYDVAGNLTREVRGDPASLYLATDYRYNSLGKVISESRPYTKDATPTDITYKLKTYRLDGQVSAETSYGYAGDLTDNLAQMSADTTVSVIAGNLTSYTYNTRGERTKETSRGIRVYDSSVTTLTAADREAKWEYTSNFSYDGLGNRLNQTFSGAPEIYKNTNYSLTWTYDKNGNLRSSNDALNGSYTFTYTPTNKQNERIWNASITEPSALNMGAIDNTVKLAVSNGYSKTFYNARGLPQYITSLDNGVPVKDADDTDGDGNRTELIADSSSNTTIYSYYSDGNKSKLDVGGKAKEFKYDLRGRLVWEYDASGREVFSDAWGYSTDYKGLYSAVSIFTIYGAGNDKGLVTTRMHSGKQTIEGDTKLFEEVKRMTVGGQVYKTYTDTLPENTNETKRENTVTNEFDTLGNLSKSIADGTTNTRTERSASTQTQNSTTNYVYTLPFRQMESTSTSGTLRISGWKMVTTSDPETDSSGNKVCRDTTTGDVVTCDTPGSQQGKVNVETERVEIDRSTPFSSSQSNGYDAKTGYLTRESSGQTTGVGAAATTESEGSQYLLDSRGNRLSVSAGGSQGPGKFSGFQKRYDATHKAVDFYRIGSRGGNFCGCVWADTLALHVGFRYDPFGNQILSTQSSIREYVAGQGFFDLHRDNYTVIYGADGVDMIRKRKGRVAYLNSWLGVPVFDYRVNQYPDAASLDRTQLYSLADGLDEETWTIVEPFDIMNEQAALEAPTESISDTLGVSPLDVTAPGSVIPSTGDEGETVAPPTAEGAAEGTTTDGTPPVASQAVPFDPTAPLPSLGDTGTTPQATSGETTPAETGELVLPESITSLDPLGIDAPINPDVPVIPEVPASDVPTDIAQPGEVEAPSLGNLPSDSNLDIAAPETLEASVPPIENAPSPVEVTPPDGFALDDGNISVFDDSYGQDKDDCHYYGNCTPEDLAAADARHAAEQSAALTEEDEADLSVITALGLAHAKFGAFDDPNLYADLANFLLELDPESRRFIADGITRAVITGVLTGPEFQDLNITIQYPEAVERLKDGVADWDSRVQWINNISPIDVAMAQMAQFETDYLSFDLPASLKVKNPFLRVLLGISEGTRLDGNTGDRMSVMLPIDVLLTAYTAGTYAAGKLGARAPRLAGAGGRTYTALREIELSSSSYYGRKGSSYLREGLTEGTGTAFAGHGVYNPKNGTIIVPEGTYVTLPPMEQGILDDIGGLIELGEWDEIARLAGTNETIADNIYGMQTYLPGSEIPNLTLKPPIGLKTYNYSVTVDSPTNLSDLLKPNMGCVQWAACTVIRR
jgi:YD repeat-containing protein